jgi:hypothetical protein
MFIFYLFIYSRSIKKLDLSKKSKTSMKISFKEVLIGSCCPINQVSKKKALEYESLKEYVISKICIKELLVKLNEIDKLKATCLSLSQIKAFEEVLNPFPAFEGVNSLWKFEESFKEEPSKNFNDTIAKKKDSKI